MNAWHMIPARTHVDYALVIAFFLWDVGFWALIYSTRKAVV